MEGWTLARIAKDVKCCISTVQYTTKRFKELKTFENRHGRGRPVLLNEKESRALKIHCLRNRTKPLSLLTAEINLTRSVKVSISTVRRSLKKWGLFGRVAATKPLLRKANIKKRLAWTREHKNWTLAQWYRVLFTDETKSEIFGNNRRAYVRSRTGERYLNTCLKPSIKHGGGSVLAWGAISAQGVSPLKRIIGTMDKKYYHNILQRHAIPAGLKLIGENFVFQEDNDPKHASAYCRNYLALKEKQGTSTEIFSFKFLLRSIL